MAGVERFLWAELANVPEMPGVYAWYYTPEITIFDLDKAIGEVSELTDQGQMDEADQLIRAFLENHLFRFFQEEPFLARLTGPLKPIYQGELQHQMAASDSLVRRLREKPDRLKLIREVLDLSAPSFASPIYIGMSDGLRTRISQHKSLIEKLREESAGVQADDAKGEAGFARQVVMRKIPPERLFVATCIIESTEGIHVDIENILNRIYYPILGRN